MNTEKLDAMVETARVMKIQRAKEDKERLDARKARDVARVLKLKQAQAVRDHDAVVQLEKYRQMVALRIVLG